MKRVFWILLVGCLLAASAAPAASYKVITQEGAIRKDRKFFAPLVARVPYGAIVQEVSRKGDWLQVSYGEKQGWMHIGAVQEQKVRLSSLAGEKARETSQEEVVLAGKGFTPEVEKAFREKNPKLDFAAVDQIQKYQIPDPQEQAFIQAGNLREPGGEP